MTYFSAVLEGNVGKSTDFEATTLNELQKVIRCYYSDMSGSPYPGIRAIYQENEEDGSREPLAIEIVDVLDDLIRQEIEEEEFLYAD